MLALIASACLFVVVAPAARALPARDVGACGRCCWCSSPPDRSPRRSPCAGRASVPVLETRPLDAMLEPATTEASIARHDPRHRRRVARSHHGRGRRWTSAELRPRARRRRRHAPGHHAPDVGRGRVDRRRHRQAAAEKRRPIGWRLSTCARGGEPAAVAARLLLRACAGALRARRRGAAHSAALRTRPFWSILSALGIPVGVVGWPLTHPAPVVRGYLVSDAYPRLRCDAVGHRRHSSSVYPPDAEGRRSPRALEIVVAGRDWLGGSACPRARGTINEAPGRIDRTFDQIARTLAPTHPTRVTVVRYSSLDRDRPLLPALRDAVGVWRRDRR